MTEIERSALTAMFKRVIYPEDRRDAAAVDAAEKDLQHPFVALDGAVSRSTSPDRAEISPRRRPQRRRHPVLSLAGADGFRHVPESRKLALAAP